MRQFRRYAGGEYKGSLFPGEWAPLTRAKETDLAVICCPYCSKTMTVGLDTHKIDSSGKINPAILCPHDPCRFQDWCALEGWFIN